MPPKVEQFEALAEKGMHAPPAAALFGARASYLISEIQAANRQILVVSHAALEESDKLSKIRELVAGIDGHAKLLSSDLESLLREVTIHMDKLKVFEQVIEQTCASLILISCAFLITTEICVFRKDQDEIKSISKQLQGDGPKGVLALIRIHNKLNRLISSSTLRANLGLSSGITGIAFGFLSSFNPIFKSILILGSVINVCIGLYENSKLNGVKALAEELEKIMDAIEKIELEEEKKK